MEVHIAWLGSLCFFIFLEVGDGSNVLFKKDHCFGMEVLDSLILSYSKLLLMGMLLCSIMWTWLVDLCSGSLFSIVKPKIGIRIVGPFL